ERLARLTQQERRILDLIAEGKTNRQIGEEMFLAEKTVKNYVSNLLSKLGMERRTEAAVFAARLPGAKRSDGPSERRRTGLFAGPRSAHDRRMTARIDPRTQLEVLDRDECLALLARESLGRLAVVSDDGRPYVFPVNFALDGAAVVFRTDHGTKL